MKNITYEFFNWGPLLYKTNVGEEDVKKILSLCKRDKDKDMREHLAGHLKEEYSLDPKDVMPILAPYFLSYQKAAHEHYNIAFKKVLNMKGVWVNFMKEGEYNPPHVHGGALSCVLYLQIPKDIKENNKTHISNSPQPGSITFKYGEFLRFNNNEHFFLPDVGDFCIFPAWLSHCVYPFKSKEERISLSANLYEVD